MTEISLVVNERTVTGSVEPRMHLADFLRDRLRLTATHIRCEQGVCGACTLLVDGAPARSCLIYAVSCQGAAVTTLEGLENDPIIKELRTAFTAEHGLQCGFCTPGMLVTARDIVMRFPNADQALVRKELSGNLCRCTGYVGIVRAVCRVLSERSQGADADRSPSIPAGLAPVGARTQTVGGSSVTSTTVQVAPSTAIDTENADVGLGSRKANLETALTFAVARPIDEVWAALADVERVARCMPGARLSGPPVDGQVKGSVAVKVGPIATSFSGTGRIVRDDERRQGVLYGAGRDRFSGSSARTEVNYVLAADGDRTRVNVVVRALLAGPLAQFGRSGIVQDLVSRLANEFGRRLEHNLSTGEDVLASESAFNPVALLASIIVARLRRIFRQVGRRVSK